MNNTSEYPSFQNLTRGAYEPRDMSPEENSWYNVIFYSICAAVVIFLLSVLRDYKRRVQISSRSLGITEKPIVPDWLEAQKERRTVFKGKKRIRFECRSYLIYAKSQSAIWWLQSLIYPGTTGKVDRGTCLASVPMENFKCGETPNDFSPISGSASGSFLTYQMFGDNKIQVTYYVEDGKTYPAGYCVYIDDPYADEVDYSKKVIKDIQEGLKYEVDLKFKREYEDQVLQKIKDYKQRILDSLTVKVCESTGKIVAVGLDQGDVMHYEWYECYEHFVLVPCQTCQLEGNKDAPPPYELLSDKD